MINKKRFRDSGKYLQNFLDEIWVRCPKCSRGAKNIQQTDSGQVRRVTCFHCGYTTDDKKVAYNARKNGVVLLSERNPRCYKCGKPLDKQLHSHAFRFGPKPMAWSRCRGCRHARLYPAYITNSSIINDTVDPYFLFPLYLQTPIGKNILWAVNHKHLQYLEDWLSADIRERHLGTVNMTMMARLPSWMKLAANRQKMDKGFLTLNKLSKEAGLR